MSRISHGNTCPTEKRHKSYPSSGRNYINNLPDGVLSHILSRLPLKDAVRTCVLSKDWEFKWTIIYNVNIHIADFSLESMKEWTFVNIVDKVKFVEIYAPSLDTFASLPLTEWNDKKDLDYTIKILGTMLDGLNINCQENIIMNGSNVVHANLECISDHPVLSLEECGLRVRKLLRELSNLTYLSFADLQAIGQTKLGLPLPKFHQLKSMHLTLDTPFDAEGLLELLHVAPVLESLVIVLNNREDYDYDSVEPVPSCVVNHLEELTFCYYECLKPKFLVEKFLLKNGAQLKTVFVSNDKESRKLTDNEMVEKLSTFPKASVSLDFRLW